MATGNRWHPRKKRSTAQKAHMDHLNTRKENLQLSTPNSTNPSPQLLGSGIADTNAELNKLKISLRNSARREERAKTNAKQMRKRVQEAEDQTHHLEKKTLSLHQRVHALEQRNDSLVTRNKALSRRLSRKPAQVQRAIQKVVTVATEKSAKPVLMLKNQGVITDEARDMVRDLVAIHNVPASRVADAVQVVAATAGIKVQGSVSERSVGQIVLEGGIAAKVQLVDEICNARGITLSSDGTTHKNTNYQSHHITYSLPGEEGGVTKFVGITHEVNHSSETQLAGWRGLIEEMYDTYNRCMNSSVDWREFLEKTKGMLTDHAEDQKKLVRLFLEWKRKCEREVRGECALTTLPPGDISMLAGKFLAEMVQGAGGWAEWEALPLETQNRHLLAARREVLQQIGAERFNALAKTEQDATDFFIWGGCCMHKELNAVKGGNAAMVAWWEANGAEPPILLMNRDNAITASSGSSAAASRAIHMSKRGAVKALDLTGAVFRHSNDKKGQQDALRYFIESELGYFLPWPDTSNTRYQSHCDGASAWLVYQSLYITYLEIIRDRKDSRTLTNIERNVLQAFHCPKTAEEMACLSLWGNCIGHPYMRQVRGSLRESSNLLDLGPLHAQLKEHIQSLISDVELVLSPDTTYKLAALDKQPFERPDAFYTVQKMASNAKTYPHLRQLFVTFLQGALNTLVRFTSEFDTDGGITRATSEQRQLARMETTNDANEGALGTLRVTARRAPRMSLAQLNAQVKYKKNETGTWMKSALHPTSRRFLRQEARRLDTSGMEKRRRQVQVEHDHKLVTKHRLDDRRKAEKRATTDAMFAAYVPCISDDAIERMKVSELDFQLRWHRRFDSKVPRARDMPTKKQDKAQVLREAVERYMTGTQYPGGRKSESAGKCDGTADAAFDDLAIGVDSEDEMDA